MAMRQEAGIKICRLRPAMGCLVALECEAVNEAEALQGVEAAWEAITRVMQRMNPAAPGSDLALLNSAAPGCVVQLDPWTTQVLRLSRRLCGASGGLFDPALPGRGSVCSLVDLGGSRWRLGAALQLDLGGIAKGYAVDRAVQAMRAQGARSGLVNAGGDLRCFGTRQRRLHVQQGDNAPVPLILRSGAIAVSVPGVAGAPAAHRGYYRGATASRHLVATLGQPLRAVAVQARDCARADAMTKVFLMADVARHAALARRCGVRLCVPGQPEAQPGRTWPEPRTTYL
jgi:thiamine biosynthesis lipoprotein